MRVPIPLMAGLQIAMGAPPAPRMIGEVDDPFQTMEVCSGGEDGTSSEEEADWKFAPGLMDDSSGDEVDSDEEEDSGPGPGCTADGGCCRGNAPPRQQFMLPRLRTTGTGAGSDAPNAAPPPPSDGGTALGAAPPQPTASAAAQVEWVAGTPLLYTDSSGGRVEVTLVRIDVTARPAAEEAEREYIVRMPGGAQRDTVRARLELRPSGSTAGMDVDSDSEIDSDEGLLELAVAAFDSALEGTPAAGGQAEQPAQPQLSGADIDEAAAGVQLAGAVGRVAANIIDLAPADRPKVMECCERGCLLGLWFDAETPVWDIFAECRDARNNMTAAAESGDIVGEVSQHARNTEIKGGFSTYGGLPQHGSTVKAEPAPTAAAAAAAAAAAPPAPAAVSFGGSGREARDDLVMRHYKMLNTSTDIHPDGAPVCIRAMMALTATSVEYWTSERLAAAGGRRRHPHGGREHLVDLDDVQGDGCGVEGCLCLEHTDSRTIVHFGQLYEATVGALNGANRRWEVVKAALIACPAVCYNGWRRWLGVGKEFVRATRKQASYHSKKAAHRNKGRQGNSVPDDVIMASELETANLVSPMPLPLHISVATSVTNWPSVLSSCAPRHILLGRPRHHQL